MSDTTEVTIDPFGWVGVVLDGRYRMERVIGSGGFGIVYAAHHIALGGPVAVKCLDLREQLDPRKQRAFLQAFQAEGRILHHLAAKAPAVVRVMDLSASTSPRGIWTPYLVLEWLEGVSLQEQLRATQREGERFSLADTVRLLTPIAEALEAAHVTGIAHRDVKPGNIFVPPAGGWRILDFGIAKVMGDETLVGERYVRTGGHLQAFSPAYGAPEQFEPGPSGLGATGPWTDVYALALIVVEMICGRRAYDGSTSSQFHLQAINRAVRPTPTTRGLATSPAVEAILQRALAVDPRNRPTSADAFWRELTKAASATPGSPHRSPHESPRTTGSTIAASRTAAAPPPRAPSAGSPATVLRSDRRRESRVPLVSGLLLATALVFLVAYGVTKMSEREEAAESEEPTKAPKVAADKKPRPVGAPSAIAIEKIWEQTVTVDPTSDGKSASHPALPSADLGFVDKLEGRGWGDKCWINLHKGFLGWAKAECIKGMQLPPSPKYKPSLLYNLGLIEKQAGNKSLARALFEASLELREHKEVRAALNDL